jgi:hypothetical protein
MSHNKDELMFLIAFEDCLHTMIKDYKFVKHAGVRHVDGSVSYLCDTCSRGGRGACDITPMKRAAMIQKLVPNSGYRTERPTE